MSTVTEVPTTNISEITNGPSVKNISPKHEESNEKKTSPSPSRRKSPSPHKRKRSESPSPRKRKRSESPLPRKRRHSESPEHLSYEERRELERKRQEEERKERKKKGLATETPKLKSKETTEDILKNYRTGGVYIPPFKMRRLQPKINDKKSIEYQRLHWDALKKSFSGIINKVNVLNIKNIIPELFSENLVRGRGLFARALMKAQQASPAFTHVYAALLAVVNTKMPQIGELVLKRVIIGFRKAYRRNDKMKCIALCKFIAHLVNQQVAHEILAGQLLGLLLEKPTDDSVELAVQFTKECGYTISQLSPKIMNAVFERFRAILHEGEIDKRVQYLIEGLFLIRKKGFKDYPGVIPELDLVEADDQITHEIELDDQLNPEDQLDYFHYDPDFEENEAEYEQIKKEILGEEDEEEKGDEEEEEEEEEVEEEKKEEKAKQTIEQSDKELLESVQLKRSIYLTIMSSLSHDECVHKLIKSGLTENHELEVCTMLIECCSQERTFLQYYGLIGQRFCQLDKIFQDKFAECFRIQYSMIHRLETNKLRNVAKFFAHLLYTDALPWSVLEFIRLTPNDTTSSSRIFIKILFQELAGHMGLKKLNERLRDEYLQQHFEGIFPKDNAKNTRFAINFFTSIGLGALTEDLREYLKNAPKVVETKESSSSEETSEESSSDESSDSDTESDSGSDSDSSDSGTESDTETESDSESESEYEKK